MFELQSAFGQYTRLTLQNFIPIRRIGDASLETRLLKFLFESSTCFTQSTFFANFYERISKYNLIVITRLRVHVM